MLDDWTSTFNGSPDGVGDIVLGAFTIVASSLELERELELAFFEVDPSLPRNDLVFNSFSASVIDLSGGDKEFFVMEDSGKAFLWEGIETEEGGEDLSVSSIGKGVGGDAMVDWAAGYRCQKVKSEDM